MKKAIFFVLLNTCVCGALLAQNTKNGVTSKRYKSNTEVAPSAKSSQAPQPAKNSQTAQTSNPAPATATATAQNNDRAQATTAQPQQANFQKGRPSRMESRYQRKTSTQNTGKSSSNK